MKKITLLFAVTTFATAFSYAQNTGKVSLVKGQKIVVENKLNTLMNQEFMGNSMEVTVDVATNSLIEVKDLKDQKYNLSNTITRVNLATSMMGQQMNYDSDKKEDREGEMGTELNKVVNSPVDIEMTENGKVIVKAETKSDKATDPSKAAIAAMLGKAADPKNFVELAFLVIPTGLKAGSSWTDSVVNEEGKNVRTYTVREIKGTDAVLDIKGTMQSSIKQQMMGNEVTTKSSGTITGESIVDMNTGIVKIHSTTLNATGTTEAMGQQIPTTTKVTSKTTIETAK